jgi:hypothetical protein
VRRGPIAPRACLGVALAVAMHHASVAAAQTAVPDESGLVPEGGIPPRSVAWHPWIVFDPYLSRREDFVAAAYASERPIGAQAARGGFEATFGQTIETPAGAWFSRLEAEWGLRYTGAGHVALLLPRYTMAAGALLGPVEISARSGVALIEVHFGSGGFGAGLFSPRAGVAVGIRIGHVRLGAAALTEYAWRWFGGPSARVETVALEASLVDISHPLPSWYRVER